MSARARVMSALEEYRKRPPDSTMPVGIDGAYDVLCEVTRLSDAAIAELEHILAQTTGQREYAATRRAEQAEATIERLKWELRALAYHALGMDTEPRVVDALIESMEQRWAKRGGA